MLTAVSIGKSCGLVDNDSSIYYSQTNVVIYIFWLFLCIFLVQESDKEGATDLITIRHIDNEELEFDPATLKLLDSGPTPKFELAVTGKAFDI